MADTTTNEKIISLGTLSHNNDKMKEYIQGEIDKIPSSAVDDALSDTSEHPVQNKVINAALNEKADFSDVTEALSGKSDTGHTHTVGDITDFPTSLPANGGNAETVNGHTVNSDVPEGAVFTDTVYTHPTTSGNKHIPSGGSSGQILRWSADGTAVWGADNNTDTKVTSVGNHYTPSGGTTTSASGGTLTDITNSSSGVQVVTGVTKDAAGHVTGVTSVALKSVNTNTTYGAATASAAGLVSTGAQTFAGNKTFNGQILPNGATAYGTPQARKLASGTAAATTTNCPSGAWYGQHS